MSDDTYDLSPEKLEIFKSLSEDLSLIDSLKELVDNAIDNWTRTTNRDQPATVQIDISEGNTRVWDNTGGVPSDEIQALFKQGASRSNPPEWSIGGYALGAKKAISRLGGLGEGTFDRAQIKSRPPESEIASGYLIDRSWFEKSDYNVERKKFEDLDQGCTEIVVGATEPLWDEINTSTVKTELKRTYKKFLNGEANGQSAEFNIIVEQDRIEPSSGTEWTYLPFDGLYPRRYTNITLSPNHLSAPIEMELEVGLLLESDPKEAGTDIYFQDRLVVGNSTSDEGGFGIGDRSLGQFTNNNRLRIKLELITEGDASDLPWDTQKKNIDLGTRTSALMYEKVKEFAQPYYNANSDIVSDAIAMPYDQNSEWAANDGYIKFIDVTDGYGRPDSAKSNLRQVKKLREKAEYHVVSSKYVDYAEYKNTKGEFLDEAAVPAYQGLISEISNEDLEPISPQEGKEIIKQVRKLRKELNSIRQVSNSNIDNILEKYTSLDDLREISEHQLKRIPQVGDKIASRIKSNIEVKEGVGEILEELVSKPVDEKGEPDTERIFELYEKLLNFDSLPSKQDIDAVTDDFFWILTEDENFSAGENVFIPDDKNLKEIFENGDEDIQFTETDIQEFNHSKESLFNLLEQFGATRLSEGVTESVFSENKLFDINRDDSETPQERLKEAWEAIEKEISSGGLFNIECPSVVWVEETGTQYQLGDRDPIRPEDEDETCKYDPDKGTVYLTPDFVVDWDKLAKELTTEHTGSKETVRNLLEKASGDLEDRAIDVILQQEHERADIIDVRSKKTKTKHGYDVEGCDLIAVPDDGGEPRFIEVKSRRNSQTAIRLIGKEPEVAENKKEQYWLYIVIFNDKTDSKRIFRLSDPANCEFSEEEVWRIKQSTWQNEAEEVVIR